jgi:hypothetical protein
MRRFGLPLLAGNPTADDRHRFVRAAPSVTRSWVGPHAASGHNNTIFLELSLTRRPCSGSKGPLAAGR